MAADGTIKIAAELDESGLRKTLEGLGKTAAVGLGAAAAAFTAFTTQSIKAYADYEQLVGGVETLFKGSADTIKNYAESAYKTANMSANQYMETITSFSASLLQGLGGDTEKAAEIANLAVIDMADNANKMGSSIESIQNAYQGFAKDNFTMLDNLRIGYGGTASEMARLVNDSGVLGDSFKATAENVKNIPFDQLVLAIHEVQTGMGITGTTAIEASETITGSWNTLTSSWTNVLTSLASGNQDFFDNSIDALVSSTDSFIDNIMGAVTYVIDGSAKLASGLISEVPEMLQKFLPAILQGAENLLNSVISELPSIMGALDDVLPMAAKSILNMLPSILEAGIEVLKALADGITESLPTLIPIAVDAILTLVDTLVDNADELLDAAIEIIMALGDGLVTTIQKREFWDKIAQIVTKILSLLIEYAPKLLGAAAELIGKLIEGLLSEESFAALGEALAAIGEFVYNEFLSIGEKVNKAGNNISQKIADGMKEGKPYLTAVMDALTDATSAKANETGINKARETGKKLGQAYGNGLEESAKDVDPAKIFGDMFGEKKTSTDEFLNKYFNLGKDSTEALSNGINENSEEPAKAFGKMTKEMYDQEILKIKKYRNQVGSSIEGEIAMREALASKLDEMSKERIDEETKIKDLRKKLADEQANDTKAALKSEEDAIKAREKAEKDLYDNAKLWIEDYRRSKEYTIEGDIAMWQELLKNYGGVLERKVEIEKNINKLSEQLSKEREDREKEAAEESKKLVNETSEAIIAALKQRNAESEELEQYALDKSLKAVKANTDDKIKEYNREYDEKIKLIDEASQAEIDALQAQIDALTEKDPSDKAYENAKKLIELNQAIAKAQTGDGDLAKATEAYNKEVKRQKDEQVAAEKKAQIEILQAQKKGIEDADKIKKELLADQNKAMEEAYEEQKAYYTHVAELEIQIATTKNVELKKLLQEELDEYNRVNKEKIKTAFDEKISGQYEDAINKIKEKLAKTTDEAEKARLRKQLDELESFKGEYFKNVTLTREKLNNLAMEAEKKSSLDKQKALVTQHYDDMNKTENLQAEAQKLSLGENQQELLDLLAEFNPDWENQGKTFFDKMGLGMESGFDSLLKKVQDYMQTLQDLLAQGVDLEPGVDAFGETDEEREKERLLKIYQQTSGELKKAQSAETTSIAQTSAALEAGSIVNNTKTVNIEQNNEFHVDPKEPSDLNRALERTSQEIANAVG